MNNYIIVGGIIVGCVAEYIQHVKVTQSVQTSTQWFSTSGYWSTTEVSALVTCLTFGSRELMAKNMATKIAAPPTLRVVFHIRYGRKT